MRLYFEKQPDGDYSVCIVDNTNNCTMVGVAPDEIEDAIYYVLMMTQPVIDEART